MHSSRSVSAERMTKRRNLRSRKFWRKERSNGCSAWRKKTGSMRQPQTPVVPNLRRNLQRSAYEKDLLHFNDGARHYRRAFFCYRYFPDFIRSVHIPLTLSDARFRNTEFWRPSRELGGHGSRRRVAGRKHLCRRRQLRHLHANLIWYAK